MCYACVGFLNSMFIVIFSCIAAISTFLLSVCNIFPISERFSKFYAHRNHLMGANHPVLCSNIFSSNIQSYFDLSGLFICFFQLRPSVLTFRNSIRDQMGAQGNLPPIFIRSLKEN